jgi:type IV pilus assembly protein PilB
MVDMGVPGYLVSGSVIAVLAQRLVRVVCPKCKAPHTPRKSELEAAGITPKMAEDATFMKGKGCANCQRGGYRGRIGVYELMMMTGKIRELVFQKASSQEIRRAAITADGMKTLYRDGINKVLRGITTLEEVYRVAKRTEDDVSLEEE